MLQVLSKVNRGPKVVIVGEEADPVVLARLGRARRFGGAILESDFRLWKKAAKCLMGAEQDQARISDAAIDKDLSVRE